MNCVVKGQANKGIIGPIQTQGKGYDLLEPQGKHCSFEKEND